LLAWFSALFRTWTSQWYPCCLRTFSCCSLRGVVRSLSPLSQCHVIESDACTWRIPSARLTLHSTKLCRKLKILRKKSFLVLRLRLMLF
jgi:hypothetical protein